MHDILEKGEYYCTLSNGSEEYGADVYKHAKDNRIYVVVLYTMDRELTTVVNARRYKKEINEIFFNPMACAIWDSEKIINKIKKDRIAA